MRELERTVGGYEIKLAANFKASLEIAEKVGDPLMIMREAAVEAMFFARGVTYDPKWRFDVKNVPLILFIGLKTAGSSMKLEDVQAMVFDLGFPLARDIASDYLTLIVGPMSEEIGENSEGSSGN